MKTSSLKDKRLISLGILTAVMVLCPFIIPKFYLYVLTLTLITGLLAMSLNMVIGYGGMYQFHHGVFYGVGAYTAGLILAKTELPSWIALAAGPLAAAFTGLVIGLFCIRLTKLYFGMLQISLGSLIWVIALRWYNFTGGDDGIHGIPMPGFLSSLGDIYYFVFFTVFLCLLCLYVVLNSVYGMTLRAVRDNPERCASIGINVKGHRLVGIVIATFFAGVAGVLFVVLEQSVFPDLLFWVFSLEIFIMCLLGGWFTFAGPLIGALMMIGLRTYASIHTDYWTMILGIVLILIIFFLPEGLLGYVLKRIHEIRGKVDFDRGENRC